VSSYQFDFYLALGSLAGNTVHRTSFGSYLRLGSLTGNGDQLSEPVLIST
jgi:hypothetical protein